MTTQKLTAEWLQAMSIVHQDAMDRIPTHTSYGKACADLREVILESADITPKLDCEEDYAAIFNPSPELKKAQDDHSAKLDAAIEIMRSMSRSELAAARVPKP